VRLASAHHVAAQGEIESKTCKQFTILQFEVLKPALSTRVSSAVNPHRPTSSVQRDAECMRGSGRTRPAAAAAPRRCRRRHRRDVRLVAAAQIEIESKVSKRLIAF
jgi:hypothetical protein